MLSFRCTRHAVLCRVTVSSPSQLLRMWPRWWCPLSGTGVRCPPTGCSLSGSVTRHAMFTCVCGDSNRGMAVQSAVLEFWPWAHLDSDVCLVLWSSVACLTLFPLQVCTSKRVSLLGGDSFVPSDADMQPVIDSFLRVMTEAVRIRVVDLSEHASEPAQLAPSGCVLPARVALLFSGGIDSLVLAALADRCLPAHETIDLINVAFADVGGSFASPDRLLGLRALRQLQCVCCYISFHCTVSVSPVTYVCVHRTLSSRRWRFIAVNVLKADVAASRAHVERLIYPRSGTMCVNIATALWFAARGAGVCFLVDTQLLISLTAVGLGFGWTSPLSEDMTAVYAALNTKPSLPISSADVVGDVSVSVPTVPLDAAAATSDPAGFASAVDGDPCVCTARIMLVGIGADEQLAGYVLVGLTLGVCPNH